ncbi:NfeD family protein [Elusimicrobiota bacterium]
MLSWYIWLFLFLVFLGVEIITTGVFYFLCFSTGALFAMLFSLLGASFTVELIVFCTVSLVSILLIRPLLKKYIDNKKIQTNVDALIGVQAEVIEPIDPDKNGKVKIAGEIWLAVCDEKVATGDKVFVESVDGTKLIVKRNII